MRAVPQTRHADGESHRVYGLSNSHMAGSEVQLDVRDWCVAQEHADSLTFSFEAPLKEYTRMVKSAKAVMADRSLALGTLQNARSDVDAKRTKLAKLRGTPGIKVRSVGSLPEPHADTFCRRATCLAASSDRASA